MAKTTQQQPKTRVHQQPKLTMKTMATLHSPKTGEKSDSQSWTKEGHKRRPQSDKEMTRTLHNMKLAKKKKSQHRQGKTQPTDVEINSRPTSKSPQHTIPQCNR